MYALPYSSLSLFLWFAVPFLSIVVLVILLMIPVLILRNRLNKIHFPKIWPPIGKSKKDSASLGEQEPVLPLETSNEDPYFWDTGKTGERYIRESFKLLGGYKRFLSNCYIPKDDGTFTEVDIILLHVSGIYVIESKNYSGWIFGNENDKQWTQSLPMSGGRSKKVRFFNPIIQNKVHLRWLRKYLDIGVDFPVYSYIVFSDRCELKNITLSTTEHTVINRRLLPFRIRRNFEKVGSKLSTAEVDSFYERLYPLTQITEEQRALHIKTVEEKKRSLSSPAVKEIRKCPLCGGELVTRTVKKGERAGKHILGCSNFPSCRYIENLD